MGLFSFLTQEIAIDLGTANTLIIWNDKVVVDEPSIVAKDIQRTLEKLGYDVPATASSAASCCADIPASHWRALHATQPDSRTFYAPPAHPCRPMAGSSAPAPVAAGQSAPCAAHTPSRAA